MTDTQKILERAKRDDSISLSPYENGLRDENARLLPIITELCRIVEMQRAALDDAMRYIDGRIQYGKDTKEDKHWAIDTKAMVKPALTLTAAKLKELSHE